MALLVIAMMTPLGANAQLAGKGAISGTVTDTTGALIPGATVSALNTANGIASTTTTGGGGNFLFSDLDPGIYTVTTTAKGFEKLVQENIHVNALESQTYNPVLAVGNASVQITVTAEPPQLETSNAVLGATMENQEYSQLPIEMGAYGQADQRRATDFAFLMPGVQGNNTNGNATTNTGVVNGSGSRGAASDVYVDGIPFVRAGGNGDPRYVWTAISVDAVDQMQVQTNGYSAMYEGQGVMNYSIKQGGQAYHGSIYEFFRNTRLDSWGFFRAQLPDANGLEQSVKPVEHMNEYGIAIGGPLIPFGSIKNKLFFFTNYNGFRYASENPTPMRYPTTAEMGGDFSADNVAIYDPASYTPGGTCAGGTTNCRTQFKTGGVNNVIPANRIPAFVTNMQKFLPAISSTALGNNYTPPNKTGLTNWSTTSRIDYAVDSRDTLTVVGSVGRQASSNPVGQTTAGRNVGPVPFNYGQTYAPKTAVWAIELTHVFSPALINQLKWGYARYNGPTFNPDDSTKYSATTMGLSGMPTGQAQNVFPITTFSGGAVVPTNWGGTTENRTTAENYTVLDTLNWNRGKHSLTIGGQVAWMLYNVVNATTGSTPLTLANAVSETAQVNNQSTTTSSTGLPYASFLLGQIDKGSFTSYLQNEFGARFRAVSPYFQDDWKVNSKLTVNLGLRYDFYPSITEVHNAEGFFNPLVINPATGLNGALQFTGNGTNTCNCSTLVNNYYKNWGPRLGAAYQIDSKTVIRASWGVMYSHGDAVGGLASSLGTLGFSAAPSFSSTKALTTMTNLLAGASTPGVIPTYTLATGAASGPAYGSGYLGNSTAPSSMQYNDPYLGGRAPEYLNWNFGVQRQIGGSMTATVNYVGSEGHFLQLDSNHARGYWADDLDPQYIAQLGYNANASQLSVKDSGSNLPTVCATYSLPCKGGTLMNGSGQALSQFLKPFPFQGVGDSFGYVGNSNYHAMQAMLSIRRWHGLTLSANYTFSKVIDDGGSFRTGYAIPVGTMANHLNQSYPADRYERSVSTSNQPQHFVATAVWAWPFGKSLLAGNPVERAILGGFTWSGVFQAFTGSPLALTESSSQTNPAQTTNMPIMNPNFTGPVRVNGKWGKGSMGTTYCNGCLPTTANTISNPSYIAASTGTTLGTAAGPFMNPVSGITSAYNYLFSDAPRTAPYGLYGPGNYQADIAMIRSFPLHITEATKLDFRAELYNLTNHTFFGVASTAVGSSTFGQSTNNGSLNRKSAQFSARIEF